MAITITLTKLISCWLIYCSPNSIVLFVLVMFHVIVILILILISDITSLLSLLLLILDLDKYVIWRISSCVQLIAWLIMKHISLLAMVHHLLLIAQKQFLAIATLYTVTIKHQITQDIPSVFIWIKFMPGFNGNASGAWFWLLFGCCLVAIAIATTTYPRYPSSS